MRRRLRLPPVRGLDAIRGELGVPARFPADVYAEALAVAKRDADRPDATDVPLVTVDPSGSRDLDQALHLARRPGGYVLHYAIADPGVFVDPGGALDAESRARGATLYFPDTRVPLYPDVLGEGAASLLPGRVRPAVLWRIELDEGAEPERVDVRRVNVRSREQLTYEQVQATIDREPYVLLREVGLLREERERERGGMSLRLPEQEVVRDGDALRVAYRAPLPVEDWNAQLSLLTGMVAARVMLDAGVGLLRTLPPPRSEAVAALRAAAEHLGVGWTDGYVTFVRSLDPEDPRHAALLTLSTTLLRGAGYTAFDGQPPEHAGHAALAAPYAHATAPLRRLADRFVNELVVAPGDPPDWVRAALPGLPALMSAAARREKTVEEAVLGYAEALVLADRVGEALDAVVVETGERGTTVQVADPAVTARIEGSYPLGAVLALVVSSADPASRSVVLSPAS